MGESDQIAVIEDQKLVYSLLGIKGLFVDAKVAQDTSSFDSSPKPLQ